MTDTPVPDADPADVEEQQRPVVDAGDDAPAVAAVPDADPADAQEQAQVVGGDDDDDDDDRR